jgi:2-dehydro-3-deoxyphosphogluconate aldolase/(4S)-4-hydroxy-2-oxoglutarate aldolase
MFDDVLKKKLETRRLVAVLVVDNADDAVPLAHALLKGGVDIMELTLRTPAALDALKRIVAEVPEMTAGIGTILTPAQASAAKKAGAAFGVSPGLNPRVLQAARDEGLSFAPGILTPSDIEQALEFDCRLMKLFPAEISGGLKYLKNISAPYAHLGIKYIPLGGLTLDNMGSYLDDPLIAAIGGSWLAPRETIKAGDWQTIENNARNARARAG